MQHQLPDEQPLIHRLMPIHNPNRSDRALAWETWQQQGGAEAVHRYVRYKNDTRTPDHDIVQDAMLIAYLEVERGRYEHREGIPFAAFVKAIAHNKIREARREQKRTVPLEDAFDQLPASPAPLPDHVLEQREREQRLLRELNSLRADRRRVLEGFLQGKHTQEIAAELAISEELVRQHKSRGIRNLRGRLKLAE